MIKIDRLKFDDIQRFRNLTNRQLAETAATSIQTIRRIKTKGYCNDMTALRVARALGIDISEIQWIDQDKDLMAEQIHQLLLNWGHDYETAEMMTHEILQIVRG